MSHLCTFPRFTIKRAINDTINAVGSSIFAASTTTITSNAAVSRHLNKKAYTKGEVDEIKTENEELLKHVDVIKQSFGFGFDSIDAFMKQLDAGLKSFSERLDYNLNIDFDGRKASH